MLQRVGGHKQHVSTLTLSLFILVEFKDSCFILIDMMFKKEEQ